MIIFGDEKTCCLKLLNTFVADWPVYMSFVQMRRVQNGMLIYILYVINFATW